MANGLGDGLLQGVSVADSFRRFTALTVDDALASHDSIAEGRRLGNRDDVPPGRTLTAPPEASRGIRSE